MIAFSDVLRHEGLDPKKVMLIRHPMSKEDVRFYYSMGMLKEFTAHQGPKFRSDGFSHWAVFLGDKGTLAKFYCCYKVLGVAADTPDVASANEPHPEWFAGLNKYYFLEYCDALREYEQKLIVDWGNSTRAWKQRGTTEKPVWALTPGEHKVFSGFEDLVLTYDELKNIADNPTIYSEWVTALSSVNAIYLIVDRESGKQYVGSAYGGDGLWGRWRTYVMTHHGGNKQMKELMCNYPERYHNFQFSILQILPKTITDEEVIHVESLYKKKLLSIPFGMNDN